MGRFVVILPSCPGLVRAVRGYCAGCTTRQILRSRTASTMSPRAVNDPCRAASCPVRPGHEAVRCPGRLPGLLQPGDLDLDEHPRGAGPGEDAGERLHVVVVPPGRDDDVPVAGLGVVGRVEAAPAVVPPLHPGVRLALRRYADLGVLLGVEVTRDVAGRDADGAQGTDGDVGHVLADPAALGPRVGGEG